MPAIRISSSADLTALLDLFAHEKVIEEGLATFFDVGWALVRIRDTSKYRAAGYDSFEQYCRRRWGWSRKHSRRLMAAVETAALLPPASGVPRPQTEAQLRPLTPLRHRPDLVHAAWARALEAANGDQPTPTEVVVAVQHLRQPRLLQGASRPAVPKEPTPASGGPGLAASR
jgi:hypothetical protein